MKHHNIKYKNETYEHRAIKQYVGRWMEACVDFVLYEHLGCDVVGITRIGNKLVKLGAEIERSERNVIRNLMRNFDRGADVIVVVCPNSKILKRVSRKVARELSGDLMKRIVFSSVDTLSYAEVLSLIKRV